MDEEIKRIVMPFECKALGATGEIDGLGAAFGNKDQGGDIIEFGAFAESLDEHRKSGTTPNMFWAHNIMEPVGHYTKVEENKKGLAVAGQVWIGKGIPKAEQAYLMASNPGEKGFSIGYQTIVSESDPARKANILKKVKVREISITPYPMNKRAVISSVKSMMEDLNKKFSIRDLEKILRDAEFSNQEAKAFLAACKTAYDDESREAIAKDAEFKSVMESIRNINNSFAKAK